MILPVPRSAFDLAATLASGQVFHWNHTADGWWEGLAGAEFLRVRQVGEGLECTTKARPTVVRYFGLTDPLPEIYATFPTDAYTQEALRACQGLRILRQPLWECLATFLFSSLKQVAHIRQISLLLRARYGEPSGRSGHFVFPPAERLATIPEAELRECKLGYRAAHLRATAEQFAAGAVTGEMLQQASTEEARRLLCSLPGVGPKIANCVLLFALGRLEAVPVDVWIARVLQGQARRKLTARQIERRLPKLGRYAGYVQQYLFHYARVHRVLPA
jgi:N-glycosylase/DNA lyase